MKSLSSIIKRSELLIGAPKIIDVSEMLGWDSPARETEKLLIAEPPDEEAKARERLREELQRKRQELEGLRLESDKILRETEQTAKEMLDKVREEARSIIAEAKEEAEVIHSQALEEAQKLRDAHEKEGFETGLKKAQQEIEADRLLALQQSQEIVEQGRLLKLDTIKSTEPDIIRLVMAIAKKLIGDEISINPNIIINILREALAYLDNPENVTVYVNPQDVEKIFEVMQYGLLNDVGANTANFNVSADPRISRGGCALESDAGSVDARMETRWSGVEKALQEVALDE